VLTAVKKYWKALGVRFLDHVLGVRVAAGQPAGQVLVSVHMGRAARSNGSSRCRSVTSPFLRRIPTSDFRYPIGKPSALPLIKSIGFRARLRPYAAFFLFSGNKFPPGLVFTFVNPRN
jgi:hypothetical protein